MANRIDQELYLTFPIPILLIRNKYRGSKLNEFFLSGSNNYIQHQVYMFNSLTVSDSFIVAQRVEEKFLSRS